MIRRAWDFINVHLTLRDILWSAGVAVLGLFLAYGILYWPSFLIPSWVAKSSVVVIAKPSPSPSPSPTPPVHIRGEERILSLWTRDTIGHACPISSTDALTADHVAVQREVMWGPKAGFAPFIVWGDMLGNAGTAQWQWSDVRRDLSLIRVVPGTKTFSAYLRRAKTVPRIGEKVYVVGFEFGKGAGDWTNGTKVTGITAGVLVYETSPGPGSSGSCVLNEDGEFVAINVWRLSGEGVGMLVVGDDWAEVPEMFLEGEK